MASTVIYPPIVDNYMPAFIAGDKSYCRVYFSLSKFNSSTDFKSVHVSIKKRDTGETVVSTSPVSGTISYTDTNNETKTATVYRGTGIILDMPFVIESINDNLYYIDIDTTNLWTKNGSYSGWIPGEVYKVQLRLSRVNFGSTINNPDNDGQSDWITKNGNNFSEWSTVCILKATAAPQFTIDSIVSIDSDFEKAYSSIDKSLEYYIKTNNIIGKYSNPQDTSEYLYCYKVSLYKNDIEIESSDIIYLNEDYLSGKIDYTFNSDIINNESYRIKIKYETINGYKGILDIPCTGKIKEGQETSLKIYNIENDPNHLLLKDTNLFYEEEHGRITYLVCGNELSYEDIKGYYIRRSDSRDNFKTWRDIRYFDNPNKEINYLYHDYAIEAGIWYKYAIQLVDIKGFRSPMVITEKPSLRDFNYSFLLGKNEKQLSLKYNNTMSSYTITVNDTITQTIGGKYPFVTRNGNMKYRTFPIEGLITFNMDDEKSFANDIELYSYKEVADLYNSRGNNTYDYVKERIFREKVMEFLLDDKPKLFKSTTEGNVLVRITNINFSPNQSLSRMIYNFSGTATEIGEASQKNLEKYGIININQEPVKSNFSDLSEHGYVNSFNHLSF